MKLAEQVTQINCTSRTNLGTKCSGTFALCLL